MQRARRRCHRLALCMGPIRVANTLWLPRHLIRSCPAARPTPVPSASLQLPAPASRCAPCGWLRWAQVQGSGFRVFGGWGVVGGPFTPPAYTPPPLHMTAGSDTGHEVEVQPCEEAASLRRILNPFPFLEMDVTVEELPTANDNTTKPMMVVAVAVVIPSALDSHRAGEEGRGKGRESSLIESAEGVSLILSPMERSRRCFAICIAARRRRPGSLGGSLPRADLSTM